jgi:hypothetical protein
MDDLKLLRATPLRAACQPREVEKTWKISNQRQRAEAAEIAPRQFLPGINHASSLPADSDLRRSIWVDSSA